MAAEDGAGNTEMLEGELVKTIGSLSKLIHLMEKYNPDKDQKAFESHMTDYITRLGTIHESRHDADIDVPISLVQ